MAGLSIHIGLNRVDPVQYGGWSGRLDACEFDAADLRDIAEANGYETQLILTEDATAETVLSALEDAAERLAPGDILLVTYSGHGAQVPDTNFDEADGQDETWVLYDREVTDDEIHAQWARFRKGVRILVLSDSCHSGTMIRARARERAYHEILLSEDRATRDSSGPEMPVATAVRAVPFVVQQAHYREFENQYKDIEASHPQGRFIDVKATVLSISACKDEETALDGVRNGLFTGTLLSVWDDGSFKKDYLSFHDEILGRMPEYQSPQLSRAGIHDSDFEAQRPFTIVPELGQQEPEEASSMVTSTSTGVSWMDKLRAQGPSVTSKEEPQTAPVPVDEPSFKRWRVGVRRAGLKDKGSAPPARPERKAPGRLARGGLEYVHSYRNSRPGIDSNTCGTAAIATIADYWGLDPLGLGRPDYDPRDGKSHWDSGEAIDAIKNAGLGPDVVFGWGTTGGRIRDALLGYGLNATVGFSGLFSAGWEGQWTSLQNYVNENHPVPVMVDVGALGATWYQVHWSIAYKVADGKVSLGNAIGNSEPSVEDFLHAWHCWFLPYGFNHCAVYV
jgi:metacaspase-1